MRNFLIILMLCGLLGCGSADTGISANVALGVPPYVATSTAASIAAGGTFTVTGFGFSFVAPDNVLLLDNSAAIATQYMLAPVPSGDQIEQLAFTLPATVAAGTYTATLRVVDQTSNSFSLTVNP